MCLKQCDWFIYVAIERKVKKCGKNNREIHDQFKPTQHESNDAEKKAHNEIFMDCNVIAMI